MSRYNISCIRYIYKTVRASYPSSFFEWYYMKFGDFVSLNDKAKTLSAYSAISLVEHCKYTFFVQYDALVMSIISS